MNNWTRRGYSSPMSRRSLWLGLIPVLVVGVWLLGRGFEPWWRAHRLRASPRPIDAILITLDTTRSDRLGCYGYPAATSPHIDRLAREGVLFWRAYAHVPLTAPSHASLLTGLIPARHGVHDNATFTLGADFTTLAEVFVEAGYRTGAFVSSFVLDQRFGLARGFAVYEDEVEARGRGALEAEVPARVTVDRAIRWLGGADDRPLFAWVHLYDPHAPYEPPAAFAERFGTKPYDGEIAYMDSEIGRLMREVESRKRPTLVAVVGDHGEALGDHGELTHSYFIYSATQRVPFLLCFPRHLPAGERVMHVVRGVDVMPTILDVAGLPIPEGMDGTSLTPWITGAAREEPGVTYLESYHPRFWWGARELFGLRSGPWLYIRSPRPELYHVEDDPKEARNIAAERPRVVERLDALLLPMIPARYPGSGNAALDAETAKRLALLGYVTGAPADAASENEDLPDAKDNTALLVGHTRASDLVRQNRLEEALAKYNETLAFNPRSVEIRSQIAQLLVTMGRHREAFEAWSELHREAPGTEQYLLQMAAARARLGDVKGGLDLLRRESGRFSSSALFALTAAELLMDLQRWPEAEQELRRATALSPRLVEAQLRLGAVLMKLSKDSEAATALGAVIDLSPNSQEGRKAARGLVGLAGRLMDAQRFAEARRSYRAALRGGAREEEVYLNLGLACHNLGLHEEVLDVLRAGVRALPDSAALHYRLGRVLLGTDAAEEGERELRRALALDPKHGGAQEALRELHSRGDSVGVR